MSHDVIIKWHRVIQERMTGGFYTMKGFMCWVERILEIPIIYWVRGHRFIKFGTVGFSGTFVNLAMLYLGQEVLFVEVQPEKTRLYLSLGTAVFLATMNNYLWNRIWTWGDRKEQIRKNFFLQMGQYFIACWLAILIQFVLTLLFAHFIHYLIANLSAIILAALINYLFNDIWTFSASK